MLFAIFDNKKVGFLSKTDWRAVENSNPRPCGP